MFCFCVQERMTPYLHVPVSHSQLCWSYQTGWRTGGTIYFVTTITPVFLCFRLCVILDSVPVKHESQQEGCSKRTYNHQAGKGRGSHCTDRGRHPGTEVDGQTTSHPSEYHPRRHLGHQGLEDAAGPWATGGDQQATQLRII